MRTPQSVRISQPARTTLRLPAGQRGIGLATALFVITAMAIIAAAISRLTLQNSEFTTEAINLARAQYAAESGAGFALHELFPVSGYPDYAAQSCGTTDHDFEVDGLNGCSASVICSEYVELNGVHYFSIESTGRCAAVERVVHVQSRFEP